MDYYTIHWERLDALPPRERLDVLAHLGADVTAEAKAARLRLIGRTVRRLGSQRAAAAELDLKTARLGQLYTQYREEIMDTRVAYVVDDELHIMDIDEHGAYVEGTVEVLPLQGDRDETLEQAGYKRLSPWERHGEADGATVERL